MLDATAVETPLLWPGVAIEGGREGGGVLRQGC